jgi:hypothetical protein
VGPLRKCKAQLPEKDDMICPTETRIEAGSTTRPRGARLSLKCVSSGPQQEDCSCQSRIPREAVLAAWRRVQAQQDGAQSSFFYVRWQSDTWLSYGWADGTIGGVYCPAHAIRRARRAAVERDELPASGLALVA